MRTKDINKEDYDFYGDETGGVLNSITKQSDFVYIKNKRTQVVAYIVLRTGAVVLSSRSRRTLEVYNKPLRNENEVLKGIRFKNQHKNGYYVNAQNATGFVLKQQDHSGKRTEYRFVMERTNDYWVSVPIGDSENPKILHKKETLKFIELDAQVDSGELIKAEIETENENDF